MGFVLFEISRPIGLFYDKKLGIGNWEDYFFHSIGGALPRSSLSIQGFSHNESAIRAKILADFPHNGQDVLLPVAYGCDRHTI